MKWVKPSLALKSAITFGKLPQTQTCETSGPIIPKKIEAAQCCRATQHGNELYEKPQKIQGEDLPLLAEQAEKSGAVSSVWLCLQHHQRDGAFTCRAEDKPSKEFPAYQLKSQTCMSRIQKFCSLSLSLSDTAHEANRFNRPLSLLGTPKL